MKIREVDSFYPFDEEDDSRDAIYELSYKEVPRSRRSKSLTHEKREEIAKQINEDMAYFASAEWSKKRKKMYRMTIKEIRLFAETRGILLPKTKKARKADLIHLIQNAEGNEACYATKECNNTNCLWHQDCIKAKEKGHSTNAMTSKTSI